jgi:hypothetical protein
MSSVKTRQNRKRVSYQEPSSDDDAFSSGDVGAEHAQNRLRRSKRPRMDKSLLKAQRYVEDEAESLQGNGAPQSRQKPANLRTSTNLSPQKASSLDDIPLEDKKEQKISSRKSRKSEGMDSYAVVTPTRQVSKSSQKGSRSQAKSKSHVERGQDTGGLSCTLSNI